MRLSRFFELAIRYGIANDPARAKRSIKGYADSAVLFGPASAQINKVLAGIDIDTSEILLADRIRQTQGLDLVLSHHPQGKALAGLDGVMQVQADILRSVGIEAGAAQGLLDERRQQVKRRLQSGNHNKSVDAARLLGIPFVCCHTPADNHVYTFITDLLKRKKPGVLKDIVDVLLEVPEYAQALCKPHVLLGDPKRPAGRILVEMTGGTEGPQAVYKHLYQCGIRTLVSMHLSEDHLKCVTAANINVVIAGHISSDNLGMNLLLDNISKHGDIEVLEASGFMRIKRGSKR